MDTAAVRHAGSIASPLNVSVCNAIFRAGGSCVHDARNDSRAGGEEWESPGAEPARQSSMAALSRTLRVTTCSQTRPAHISSKSGPSGVLPRVGLKPTNPQQDAGMRIEPPPSLACPIGAIPAATAAAEPPLDPPTTRSCRQGLRVAP